MSTSAVAAREYLIGLLPPGSRRWLALETTDNIGRIFTALATAFKRYGFDVLDTLRSELDFLRGMSARLPDWEAALGLSGSSIATFGSDEARRAQIVARLRERGTPTPEAITAALAAIVGSTTPITILEHDRPTLTAAHTHTNATSAAVVGGGTVNQTVTVADNTDCSLAGAQLVFDNLAVSNGADFIVTLTGADGVTVKTWDGAEGWFGAFPDPLHLYAPEFAGTLCDGVWTLTVSSVAGNFSFDDWSLFVEGMGRVGFTAVEGLGARVYEWSASVDESLVDPGKYDRAVAFAITRAWNPAHTEGGLVLVQTDGTLCALSDDANAIVDFAVAC